MLRRGRSNTHREPSGFSDPQNCNRLYLIYLIQLLFNSIPKNFCPRPTTQRGSHFVHAHDYMQVRFRRNNSCCQRVACDSCKQNLYVVYLVTKTISRFEGHTIQLQATEKNRRSVYSVQMTILLNILLSDHFISLVLNHVTALPQIECTLNIFFFD